MNVELHKTDDGYNVTVNGHIVVGIITMDDPVLVVYDADGDVNYTPVTRGAVWPLSDLGVPDVQEV